MGVGADREEGGRPAIAVANDAVGVLGSNLANLGFKYCSRAVTSGLGVSTDIALGSRFTLADRDGELVAQPWACVRAASDDDADAAGCVTGPTTSVAASDVLVWVAKLVIRPWACVRAASDDDAAASDRVTGPTTSVAAFSFDAWTCSGLAADSNRTGLAAVSNGTGLAAESDRTGAVEACAFSFVFLTPASAVLPRGGYTTSGRPLISRCHFAHSSCLDVAWPLSPHGPPLRIGYVHVTCWRLHFTVVWPHSWQLKHWFLGHMLWL
jgi:hypothetical protein